MRFIFFILAIFLMAAPAMAGEAVTYKDGDTVLEGYLAKPDDSSNAPVVMIVHQWKGLGTHEKAAADLLAKQGYIAFAIDMYGQGIRPATIEAAGIEATKYKSNVPLARQRINAALTYARTLPGGSGKIGVIGYCFGGTMALELARSGADINAVVSFHGGLATPAPVSDKGAIKPKLEIHHGAADPHVAPAEVAGFMQEILGADAEMQFYSYPGAVHSFTEITAGDDPSKGAAYNKYADEMSWMRTLAFLDDTLK